MNRLTNIQKTLLISEILKTYSENKLSSSQALLYAQDFITSFSEDKRIGKEYREHPGGPNYYSYNLQTALTNYKWKIAVEEEKNMNFDRYLDRYEKKIKVNIYRIERPYLFLSFSRAIDKKLQTILNRIFSDFSDIYYRTPSNQIVVLDTMYGVSTYEIDLFPLYLTDGKLTVFVADMAEQMKLIKHGDFRYATPEEVKKFKIKKN